MECKKAFLGSAEIVVFPPVYESQEDSFLLAEKIRVKEGVKALDMGCGSGIQSVNMALQGANVLAVDINQEAVRNTLENAKRFGLEGKITSKKAIFSQMSAENSALSASIPYIFPGTGKKTAWFRAEGKEAKYCTNSWKNFPGSLTEGGSAFLRAVR